MDAFYDDETMMMARQKLEDPMQQADRERLVQAALEDKEKHPPISERAFTPLGEPPPPNAEE